MSLSDLLLLYGPKFDEGSVATLATPPWLEIEGRTDQALAMLLEAVLLAILFHEPPTTSRTCYNVCRIQLCGNVGAAARLQTIQA